MTVTGWRPRVHSGEGLTAGVHADEIALARHHLRFGAYMNGGNPHGHAFAFEQVGINEKRACYLYDKWTGRGWADCGVTIRSSWLTEEGVVGLTRLVAEYDAKQTHTSAGGPTC